MDLNLRQLEAFAAVARLSSFTAAARQLGVSQPALTVQIRQLEEVLTVRLIDRNTRSVKLTQVGRELAPVVERLLAELHAIVDGARDLSRKARGTVRVAALPSIAMTILPRVLMRMRKHYPAISVVVREGIASEVVEWVRSEQVDLGIGSPEGPDASIDFRLLFKDQMCVVLPPGSPLARKRRLTLRDLAGDPLVLPSPGSSVRRLVDHAAREQGIELKAVYEACFMHSMAAMARAGLGAAVLPTSAMDLNELSGLRVRPLGDPPLVREIGILQKHGQTLSPSVEGFIEVLLASPRTVTLDEFTRANSLYS